MAQSIYTPPQVEAPTQSSTGRCDHDTAVPWRKQSSRRFFLDEPGPPHSISAPSLDHLIGHREDSRRNGEAVPWRSRHSPNRKPPFREALPTSVAVEAPLAEWVPSADRQDLCRKMRTKPRNRGLSRGEPKVRIHLPPAVSLRTLGSSTPATPTIPCRPQLKSRASKSIICKHGPERAAPAPRASARAAPSARRRRYSTRFPIRWHRPREFDGGLDADSRLQGALPF
jgi:hypothetical protein